MKKAVLALLFGVALGVAHGQPPISGYQSDGSGGWTPLVSSATAGALISTPPPQSLYCYNTSLKQWVPFDSSCVSGGSATPSGPAGGDLGGTYPNPSVVGLNGVSLAGLGTGFLFNTTGTGVPSSVGFTGTGNVVLNTSPTLVTPALGTPSSGVATNLTGAPAFAITNMTGTGTNLTFVTPALGTPVSGVITNLTGTCSTCVANSATLSAPIASPTFTGTVTEPLAVISGNGAASVSPLIATGTVETGGSATTNFPHFFIQPIGTTAASTWSTNGTGLGMNLATGFTGNFLDFHVAGGASLFSVSGTGIVLSGNAYGTSRADGQWFAATGTVTNAFQFCNSGFSNCLSYQVNSQVLTVPGSTGNITAPRLVSNIATGTAPLTVTSTTPVANLTVTNLLPSGKFVASGQTAATAAQTLVTTTATSTYQVNAVVTCDTTVAAATVTLSIAYTDPSSTAQTVTPSAAACTALGASSSANVTQTIRAKTGTTITVAAAISGSPNYDIAATALQITSN